jgi:hypothetical protein
MGESAEEARFREHMAQMRQAARGLGRDFATEFGDLDEKIERFGHATAQDAKYLSREISDGFANLGRSIDDEVRRLPGRIADGVSRAGGATRGALLAAGKRTREGTRNALASAAGVNRKPIRSWSAPSAPAERPLPDDEAR